MAKLSRLDQGVIYPSVNSLKLTRLTYMNSKLKTFVSKRQSLGNAVDSTTALLGEADSLNDEVSYEGEASSGTLISSTAWL